MNGQQSEQLPPRRFSRRQIIGAGVAVAAGTSGWILLKSRQSAAEPPLALLHAGDEASRAFAFALQAEMTRLGAREAQVFGTFAAANETLGGVERGIYGLVAAGAAPAGQVAVIAEIREAAWHTTLWTQRRRVSAAQVKQGAEFWYTALAATMASASRGVFHAKMRANPGAIRIFEEAMEPWRKAGLLLPLAETEMPREKRPEDETQRVVKGMRDALAIDPAFAIARGRLALTLAWRGEWEAAEREARQTIAEEERNWAANYALGLLESHRGDKPAACRMLGRCLEVAPLRVEIAAHLPQPCEAASSLVEEVKRVTPRHAVWVSRL